MLLRISPAAPIQQGRNNPNQRSRLQRPMIIGAQCRGYAGQITGSVVEGGAPPWLPSSAISFVDFQNSHYYAGGGQISDLATIFGTDGDAGSSFNPADISSGGLAGTSQPNFLGPLLADMVRSEGITIVADVTAARQFEFDLVDDFVTFNIDYYFTARSLGGSLVHLDGDNEINSAQLSNGTGRSLIAVTLSATHLAISIDGQVVDALTVAVDWSVLAEAVIYGDYDFLRSLTVYPAVSDAALRVLSTA